MSGLAEVAMGPDFDHQKVGKGWHEGRWSHECRCGRFFPKMADWSAHRYDEFAAAVTDWLTERLASDEVREAVVRAIYGDGLDGAPEIATAALTAVTEALREGAS